jgi:CDP-glucose 4,6-dehydratase
VGERECAVEDVVNSNPDGKFWSGRRVFLTGHTGFKGAWMTLWLNRLGAEVHGYALAPDTEPSLWEEIGAGLLASETVADVGDEDRLREAINAARPQVVLHLAAQALVRVGYAEPVKTVATNTMGTVRLLEALRGVACLESVLIVTTDKVYANEDCGRDFVETDPLGGDDPYSASKAAAEILTRSYARSFLEPAGVKVATARAGNVIGGGDWSRDRLVPDVWRAARSGIPLKLRSPDSTRPWQHVLDALAGYLRYIEMLAGERTALPSLNFGPPPSERATVAQVAYRMGSALGLDTVWERDTGEHPPEMNVLSLNPDLARDSLGWSTRLPLDSTLQWTADWYAAHQSGRRGMDLCLEQIHRYESLS